MRYISFILCSLFILSWPLAGQAFDCPKDVSPRIQIIPDAGQIKTDFTRSKYDLDEMSGDRHNPYGQYSLTDVGGLMEASIRVETDASFMLELNQQTGQTCAWFDSVNLRIKIDPTIFVAYEYPKGSCLHESIYWHEIKHVNTDRAVVNKYLPKFEHAVNNFIDQYGVQGPVTKAQADQLQDRMMDQLTSRINRISKAMEDERHQRQRALDTRAEYDRVMGECN